MYEKISYHSIISNYSRLVVMLQQADVRGSITAFNYPTIYAPAPTSDSQAECTILERYYCPRSVQAVATRGLASVAECRKTSSSSWPTRQVSTRLL